MLAKIMSGRQDANIAFADLCNAVSRLGFTLTIRGSHHVFTREGFDLINLQPVGHLAKSYQVRQVRQTLKKGGI